MAVRPEILDSERRGFVVFDDASQLEHRGMVVREVCRLEGELVASIACSLEAARGIHRRRTISDLDDWGTKKLADLAYFLGLVSEEDRTDICSLSRLRDRYAHDLERGQLDSDAKMFGYIQDTNLYKRTAQCASLTPQAAFLAIVCELVARLHEAAPGRGTGGSGAQQSDGADRDG